MAWCFSEEDSFLRVFDLGSKEKSMIVTGLKKGPAKHLLTCNTATNGSDERTHSLTQEEFDRLKEENKNKDIMVKKLQEENQQLKIDNKDHLKTIEKLRDEVKKYAVMAANHKAHSGENESQQKKSSRTAKRPLENEREPLVDESEQPSKKVKFSVGEKVRALYKDGHSYKARIIRINKIPTE
ncbi:uncharacterized protein LOC123566635 isoform X3 [Mercenaria mercenaria]|uniref:uncharacterized protein LOC123566635 isoform X3 n=1 Tax=Mercenaria mercenaria TaxID=6596 RepID=UPI00234F28C0|nr:uncharacterized protein LOC123566635 isoform X3 [Mercenaria mercenaria]XP_053406195.1 uncharacterized protein LOC123566635 isoform X3 [Mercenaria mercenaria]